MTVALGRMDTTWLTQHSGNELEGERMTEQEWLESDEPGRMLDYLRGKTSVRKLRLFACACCRLQADYIAEVRVGRLCLRPYEGMDKETQLVFDTAEKSAESCFPIGKKNFRFN